MQSARIGEKIKFIKTLKHKVQIEFDNLSLELTMDVFSNHYLYIGKIVSFDELKEIQYEISLSKMLSYARNITAKNYYTQKEITNKLILKNTPSKDITFIVNKLKEESLIDDVRYASLYVEMANKKNLSKKIIIRKLINKGIDPRIIENIDFNNDDELSRCLTQMKKLNKKYSNLSNAGKEEKIKQKLFISGFDSDTINNAFNNYEKHDYLKESFNCLNEGKKLCLKLNRMSLSEKDKRDKFISSLYKKGYQLDLIKKTWEDVKNEY